MDEDEPIEHSMVTKAIENAQRKVEGHNFDIRKHLLEYDDVMNKQREVIYAIPEEFEGMLAAGMRVHVPFGQGNRLIQGIVVGFDETGGQEELKEIAEVLDFRPVLNQEQLWLADELRKSVFSYKISLLKAVDRR